MELVRAGREDRGKYQARAAVKQKKVCLAYFYISCVLPLRHVFLVYLIFRIKVYFPFPFGCILESSGRDSTSNNFFQKLSFWWAPRRYSNNYLYCCACVQTGGLSNQQKEHKKALPLAARRSKIQKSREEKRKQQRRSGKQFRGKKAWK